MGVCGSKAADSCPDEKVERRVDDSAYTDFDDHSKVRRRGACHNARTTCLTVNRHNALRVAATLILKAPDPSQCDLQPQATVTKVKHANGPACAKHLAVVQQASNGGLPPIS